jgi:hypothetical protein
MEMDKIMKPYYPVWVLLVSLTLLVSVATAADPWEGFIPSSVNGTAPYTVTFVSISYNDPTAWNWSFTNTAGNNTEVWFSQTKNTTITFHYGGNYSIRLNSSNTDGFNISPFLVYVNVTGPLAPAPIAAFTSTTTFGSSTATFIDTSTLSPSSWVWEYRNRNVGGWVQFSTNQNPAYSFPDGSYDIKLTATNEGGSDEEIKEDYINMPIQPSAIPTTLAIENGGGQIGSSAEIMGQIQAAVIIAFIAAFFVMLLIVGIAYARKR